MNVINIDGQEYDPYFILGVTQDDSDDHIKEVFRKKVKKYHPDKIKDKKDKTKYEYYFKVIVECYSFIKKKRQSSQLIKPNRKKKESIVEVKNISKKELDDFNKKFEKSCNIDKKNKHKKLEKIEDYDNNIPKITKQFSKKKFSTKDFNAVFEYNKNLQNNDISSNTLIYKTTDGFFAYNTADVGNQAMVSTYNGLLISGDTIGEVGNGYWSNDYSDYNQSYGGAIKNPTGKLDMKNIYKENEKNKVEPRVKTTFNEYQKSYNTFKYTVNESYNKEQDKLFKRTFDHLLEKEKWDQHVVMKYKDQYNQETIEQALNGELETTPTLKENLTGFYKQLRNG